MTASGPVFDATFYQAVLPDRAAKECAGRPDHVPVVELRLGDGTVLDLCHVLALSERWLSVAFFRDSETCEDMDVAFLPYELVVRVTVSLHHPSRRKFGFSQDTRQAEFQNPPASAGAASPVGGVQ